MTEPAARYWPGERFGLPEDGPRSVARFGRRLGAIAIDWAISYGLSWLFFREKDGTANPWATLAVFAVLTLLFELFFNASIGHLLLRMRVVPIRGGSLAPWRPLVRTLLLCLAVPALIWDRDQRGLHDRVAGTVLVRV
ncbi:MAG: RDD family protein [Leifsonia sp.]